jgi:hypothetical protein
MVAVGLLLLRNWKGATNDAMTFNLETRSHVCLLMTFSTRHYTAIIQWSDGIFMNRVGKWHQYVW